MKALGINDHHQAMVVQYMRFARYQRGQRIKAVDLNFKDVKDSRLTDNTYTIDEVEEMLDGLLAVVHGEVETEFINTAHTNILLLRQLFQQAEKWHLKLNADVSELENRELLEKIAEFEEMEFSGARKSDGFSGRLEPMNESGGAALLNIEIQRLQDENAKLKERLHQLEGQATSAVKDRSQLKSELERANRELGAARPSDNSEELDALQRQMQNLKSEMNMSSQGSHSKVTDLEGDLTSTKHELLRIKDMLDMAEKELEKKVSQTAPFKNLKSMLTKKNEQIKELRRKLSK
ncbi:hypothetical protein CAPTEDRAFT_2656 [Capitella teleta]|uniref:Leucine zipper transcription factor-like protein 1 n=1 Tax=Capitella teleta TaxID=283909 RepID=R7U6E1_CAPTE|nr:hypothetical protein CAPTEDRAFT_2656 [Capitella teleta]|eukprot:ELT99246.1 hypothetical protein CAPTEDRAFT_2656 [Capitella teleta]